MNTQEQVQENNVQASSLFLKSLATGFIGGLFWSSLGAILYYFNMMEVAPKSFLLRSWLSATWTDQWLGHSIAILLAGVVSMFASSIYYGLFRKTYAIWPGIIYGVVLWGLVFFVLHPLFSNIPHVHELEINTIVSTLSLYVLYGLFIGYSISYHYFDAQVKTKEVKAN